jgi:2-dehydropantoate 2-reductase
VISLQNGLEGCEILRDGLPGWDVRAAMVPFNVVPLGPGQYHRASSGDIIIQAGPGGLGDLLTAPDFRVIEIEEIASYQWGKLLINLGNALNALSGLTLQDQLTRRDWRRLMADQMAEALAVLKSAGITATSTTPLPVWTLPHVLRLPTPLFTRIAARMLTIDPTARSSMSYDLAQHRLTEIDSLQGTILKLGLDHGIATPICTHVAHAIRTAEANKQATPGLGPSQLRP